MKKIIGILIVTAVVMLVLFGVQGAKKLSYEALEKNAGFMEMQLHIVAQDINAHLPRKVNDELRLDETRAGPGMIFTSFFTLLGETTGALLEQKRTSLLEADTRATCDSRDLKSLLDAGGSIVHRYRTQDGNDAFSMNWTAESCATQTTIPQ